MKTIEFENAVIRAQNFGRQMAKTGITNPEIIRRRIKLEPRWSAPGFDHERRQIIKEAAVDAAQR